MKTIDIKKVIIGCLSISFFYQGAYGMSVKQVEKQDAIENQQQAIDFPVPENWPAGQGENAVWVEPRQRIDVVGLDNIELDGPKYKMHLDVNQPEVKFTSPDRIEKSVGQIELLSWD